MRKRMAALCMAAVLAGPPALAQEAETGLLVRGEGHAEAAPDMATLALGVSSQAGTASEAMARTSEKMRGVLDRVSEADIAERDVQTSRLTLSPLMEPREQDGLPEVRGYVAANIVSIRVRDLSDLPSLLDTVVGEGANTIEGLNFDVSDRAPLEDEARDAAVADARRKAERMAKAAGVELGPLRLLAEEGGSGGPMMMAEARMSQDSVPIAEGEIRIERNVRMVFDLDP